MKSPDGLLAISLRVKARVFKTQGAWVFSLRESSARLRVFNPTKDSRAGLKKLSVCPRCRGVYSKPWVTSFRVQPYMSLLCPEYVASPSTIENFPFKHKSRFSSDQSYHTLSKGWWLRRVCILFFLCACLWRKLNHWWNVFLHVCHARHSRGQSCLSVWFQLKTLIILSLLVFDRFQHM